MRFPSVLLIASVCLCACLDPTQVTFDITTDIPCADLSGTAITVGLEGETEKAAPTKIVKSCSASGTVSALGTYAATPKNTGASLVASFKVAVGLGTANVEADCTATNGYRGCVVARRRINFVPHRSLKVPVELFLACRNVECDQNSTCNQAGRCTTSLIDTEQCDSQNTCHEVTGAPGMGLPCFNTAAADPLFCTSSLDWCTRDTQGQRACAQTPLDTGTSFQCRNARDCGPGLFCVTASAAGLLGKCFAAPAPTATLLCTADDVTASCRVGERSCTADAGDGMLACAALDAGPVDAGPPDAGPVDSGVIDAGPGPWAQQAYVKASNPDLTDAFGVVSLSGDGRWLAVGAPDEDSAATGINGLQSDNTAAQAGAVYLFERTATGWVQRAYLKGSNTEAGDNFGSAVSLSQNGSTLVVGADAEDSAALGVDGVQTDNSQTNSGAAYVFERAGSTWAQTAYLKSSNSTPDGSGGDAFGRSVALSADGSTLVVGAETEDSNATGVNGDGSDNSSAASGAAYVFTRTGPSWVQQAYLKASNSGVDDRFGLQVAINGDGNVVVIGAQRESSAANTVNGNGADNSAIQAGAAYIFRRSAGTWAQEAYLKPANAQATDRFGASVSVSADGKVVAVGAPFEDGASIGVAGDGSDNSAPFAGAGYIFRETGGVWAQEAYLKAFNTETNDEIGVSAVISGDGTMVFFGARYEAGGTTGIDGNLADNSVATAGALYSYEFVNGAWVTGHYFKPTNISIDDQFGSIISVSTDARTLVCGMPREDSSNSGINGTPDEILASAGAVYIFSR